MSDPGGASRRSSIDTAPRSGGADERSSNHSSPRPAGPPPQGDSRAALRRHFETDAAHVVVAVLAALSDTDDAKPEEVADAIVRYGIEPDAVEPRVA